MYRIFLYRDAAKFLSTLDNPQQERIRNKVRELRAWPVHHLDIKPMAGDLKGYYRLRVGDFRVLQPFLGFAVYRTQDTLVLSTYRPSPPLAGLAGHFALSRG